MWDKFQQEKVTVYIQNSTYSCGTSYYSKAQERTSRTIRPTFSRNRCLNKYKKPQYSRNLQWHLTYCTTANHLGTYSCVSYTRWFAKQFMFLQEQEFSMYGNKMLGLHNLQHFILQTSSYVPSTSVSILQQNSWQRCQHEKYESLSHKQSKIGTNNQTGQATYSW